MYNPYLSNKKPKFTEKITNKTKIRHRRIQLIGHNDEVLASSLIDMPEIKYKRTRKKQSRKRKALELNKLISKS